MKAEKILFITQGITPFVPESPIAKASYDLPHAIQDRVKEIRTFTPLWGTINTRRNNLHEVIRLSGMNLIIDDTDHPLIIKVASLPSARMQVYFIENDDYFHNRLMITDENGTEYSDNDERMIFFNLGVLEAIKKQRWCPDVIHCKGWLSSLVPLYARTAYKDEPSFRDSKIFLSLFEDDFKQPFTEEFIRKIPCKDMTQELLDGLEAPVTCAQLIKLAIKYSDGIIIHGENIPQEYLDYASSLDKEIMQKQQEEEAHANACYDFYNKFLEQ